MKVVKNGKKRTGKQNFLCRSCGKQFQNQYQYAGCRPENKVLALKLLIKNSGIRDIETVLGVHGQTILRWLNQKADQCQFAPKQQHYGQVQIDQLWTFVKQRKKQKRWLFYAYAPETDEILAWSWGTPSRKTMRKLYEQIQKLAIDCFCSDDWPAFQEVFPKDKHSIRLRKETRAEIEQMRRQTRDKKQHIRLSVLIMLDEGFTYEVIAVSLGIDADTVGNYKRKYLGQGLEAYLKDDYVANQGQLSLTQLEQVHQQVEQGLGFPRKSGSPAGCVLLIRDFSGVEHCFLVGATNDEQSPYQFT